MTADEQISALRRIFPLRALLILADLNRQGFRGRLTLDLDHGVVLCMETTCRERFDKDEVAMRGPGNAGR